MEIGQIVFSKRGRDKNRAFVVVSTERDYVFLVDGQMRPLNKPKKKKVRHIQPTNTVIELHQVPKENLKDAILLMLEDNMEDFRKKLEGEKFIRRKLAVV